MLAKSSSAVLVGKKFMECFQILKLNTNLKSAIWTQSISWVFTDTRNFHVKIEPLGSKAANLIFNR